MTRYHGRHRKATTTGRIVAKVADRTGEHQKTDQTAGQQHSPTDFLPGDRPTTQMAQQQRKQQPADQQRLDQGQRPEVQGHHLQAHAPDVSQQRGQPQRVDRGSSGEPGDPAPATAGHH